MMRETWWEAEIPTVTNAVRNAVRRRYPWLQSDLEDIAQSSVRDLIEEVRSRSDFYPPSWYSPESMSVPGQDVSRFYALAHTILRRRAADHIIEITRTRFHNVPLDTLPEPATASSPATERQILMKRVLDITLQYLFNASKDDRGVIEAVLRRDDQRGETLTDRDRKHLQRLRERLKQELHERLGASVKDLLA